MILDTTRRTPREVIERLFPREDPSCKNGPDMNTCEKPQMSMGTTFIILLCASLVVICCIVTFLCFLHRRRMRLDKREDAKDIQELDDYGMGPSKAHKVHKSRLPKEPPPAYVSQDRGQAEGGNWKRDSGDSLTPSLRQAMGVVPHDTLANR
ncbi:hypothetical protein ACJ41O_007633 [Fusarium nematophilum]